MAPLLRRSWAPVGRTPVILQRTRSHQKISVIAGLCIHPCRDQVRLYFRLHPNNNISSVEVLYFIKQLLQQLKHPIVLIWDRLLAHRANKVKNFIDNTSRLHVFFLPPYAPELNPVENVWSYLKMNPLVNMALDDLALLAEQTRHHARSIQRKQTLLRAFVKHSPLSLRLK